MELSCCKMSCYNVAKCQSNYSCVVNNLCTKIVWNVRIEQSVNQTPLRCKQVVYKACNVQLRSLSIKLKQHYNRLVSYQDLNIGCPTERILRILTASFEVYVPLGRTCLGTRLYNRCTKSVWNVGAVQLVNQTTATVSTSCLL